MSVEDKTTEITKTITTTKEATPTTCPESSTKPSTSESGSEEPLNKKRKLDIPEGMTKSAWKRLEKRRRWEENKEKLKQDRKERKKQMKLERRAKMQEMTAKGEDITKAFPSKKPKINPEDQIPSGAKVILDCAFDDLMLEKEVVSLSGQITRSGSIPDCPIMCITNQRISNLLKKISSQCFPKTYLKFVISVPTQMKY
ncbi:unnamed protein product [Ambrosiozyma monospora]|uniref:Unnamed protein product n=1 Tax=Ambrosiozyma monospora TaxID=43982 RepID=A0ACB5T8B8_AMBMO|nr:unnamed protein product [Ambrosiozyma monospora]